MDNKIFSAFQLTVLTVSTLVYYIIKIMSINFLQPLSWLWFTPHKSLTMPLKRWMEMNVLNRVQGCNRIIVQGHGEIEDQWAEGKGLESVMLGTGRKMQEEEGTLPQGSSGGKPIVQCERGLSWGICLTPGRCELWEVSNLESRGCPHSGISYAQRERK